MNPWIYVGLKGTDKFLATCRYRRVDEKSTRLALEAIATVFEVEVEELIGKRRLQHIAEARHAYCYILHSTTRLSLRGIADPILRHHATVINSVKIAERLIEIDGQYRDRVRRALVLFKSAQNKNEVLKNNR